MSYKIPTCRKTTRAYSVPFVLLWMFLRPISSSISLSLQKMGITDAVYFTFCKPYFESATSILELGAQIFLVNGRPEGYFKNLFPLPIDCLDITGENGSMTLNLSTELIIDKQYDLITNFGTSEHVANQFTCWKNIHSFCKLGGYVISEIPETGS